MAQVGKEPSLTFGPQVITDIEGISAYKVYANHASTTPKGSSLILEADNTVLQAGAGTTFTFVGMMIHRNQGSATDCSFGFGYSDAGPGTDTAIASFTTRVEWLGTGSGQGYVKIPDSDVAAEAGTGHIIMLPRFVVPNNKYPHISASNGGAVFNWAGIVWGILA